MNERLISLFQPLIFIHPKEEFYPILPHTFFNNSVLVEQDSEKVILSPTTFENVFNWSRDRNFEVAHQYYLQLDEKRMNGIIAGSRELWNIPAYAIVNSVYPNIQIHYIFVFGAAQGYNFLYVRGPRYLFSVSHFTIEINPIKEEIIRCYYGDSYWLYPGEYREFKGRPIIYLSKGSHIPFPFPSIFIKLKNSYIVDHGPLWEPIYTELFTKDSSNFNVGEMGWLYFVGLYERNGKEHPMTQKYFFQNKKEKESNQKFFHFKLVAWLIIVNLARVSLVMLYLHIISYMVNYKFFFTTTILLITPAIKIANYYDYLKRKEKMLNV